MASILINTISIFQHMYNKVRNSRSAYPANPFSDDTFLANLTVREQLHYSAKLRLPRELPRSEKIARVSYHSPGLLYDFA